jgi:hypothetical protein
MGGRQPALASLLQHLIGTVEETRRDRDPEPLGGLEVELPTRNWLAVGQADPKGFVPSKSCQHKERPACADRHLACVRALTGLLAIVSGMRRRLCSNALRSIIRAGESTSSSGMPVSASGLSWRGPRGWRSGADGRLRQRENATDGGPVRGEANPLFFELQGNFFRGSTNTIPLFGRLGNFPFSGGIPEVFRPESGLKTIDSLVFPRGAGESGSRRKPGPQRARVRRRSDLGVVVEIGVGVEALGRDRLVVARDQPRVVGLEALPP